MYLIVVLFMSVLFANKIVIKAKRYQMGLFHNLMIIIFYEDHVEMNLELVMLLMQYILIDLLIIVVDVINLLGLLRVHLQKS
jgi:hypothetical protein